MFSAPQMGCSKRLMLYAPRQKAGGRAKRRGALEHVKIFCGGVFCASQRGRHRGRHSARHAENPTRELNADGADASQRGVKARPGQSFKAAEARCDAPCDAGALRRTAYMRLDVYIVPPPRLGLRHSGLCVELSRNVKRGATQRCDTRRDPPCDTPPVTQKTHPCKKFSCCCHDL
jgi:hypothetical protein